MEILKMFVTKSQGFCVHTVVQKLLYVVFSFTSPLLFYIYDSIVLQLQHSQNCRNIWSPEI